MADENDMDLIREYAERNSERAFAALVERHINLVYSVALRYTNNSTDAEDITQAVFILLARKAASLRQRATVTGWLYETTRLTVRQFLRSKARQHAREQEAYMQSTINESDGVWRQLAPHLEEAMNRLSEKERTLLALRFFENKTGAEAAALLGIREWAAHKRSARALEKLRTFFAKRGVVSTTSLIAGAMSAHSVQAAPIALKHLVTTVALAKEAAVGSSTLIMAKGALKIMTWTKAKMAVLSGAIIALAAISTIIVAEHRQKAPPFQPGRLKLPTGSVTPMVECGGGHNVLILASSGSLWTWGEEELGWPVLGLADTNIEKTTHMLRIGHDSDWTSIAAGVSDCLAIKSDGSLWGWGANFCYQLGDGTQETRVTPVPSVPGHDWKQAAAGNNVSLAIKNDGTLWSWGESSAGNLGIGALDESTNAIQVGASTNWTKVWAGDLQTIGLQADGSLWFWGSFTGDTKDKQTYRVPVRISPETNWVDACLGYYTAFAIKSDGTLWSWGREARDYTGETDPGSIFTPKQVGSESDWQSCASMAGMFYHILKKKDGSLWAMDASEYRMIKPATQYQPVKLWKIKLKKDVDVAAYAAGIDSHGVVLTRDGEVWTWGPVMGEHGAKDYGPHGGMKYSNSKKIRFFDEPWQVSNVE